MQLQETRNYGVNQIIKRYARFPWYKPLPVHLEHGWTPDEFALKSDLLTRKPLMLVYSKRRAAAWKKKSKTPVAIMGSPFIHFKNMNHIAKKKKAKGTIAFPGHSTYDLDSNFSLEQYCRQLKKLSAKYQPITICLFWFDFVEKADAYRKFGFNVVTTGYKFSTGLSFVKNFYKILSAHKYATSNEIGSHTFYAVDLGLPFFLTGEKPLVINVGNDVNADKPTHADDFKYGAIATRLFDTGPVTKISPAQKKFVESEMGLKDCLSKSEMHKLLTQYDASYQSFGRAILYLIESAILKIVLNGPWGKSVVSARKKIVRKQKSRS